MTHPPLGFRCGKCGRCCQTVRVPLTDGDLARLHAASGEPLESIVEWLAPDEIDMTGEPETFVRLPEGRRLMVLRHRGGGCLYLDGSACAVHSHRPLACAAFPFFVAEDDRVGRLPGAHCEPSGEPRLADLAPLSQRLSSELEAYAWRVDAWNRAQRHRLRMQRRLLPAAAFLEASIRGA